MNKIKYLTPEVSEVTIQQEQLICVSGQGNFGLSNGSVEPDYLGNPWGGNLDW